MYCVHLFTHAHIFSLKTNCNKQFRNDKQRAVSPYLFLLQFTANTAWQDNLLTGRFIQPRTMQARLHLVLKLFQNNSLKRLQFYWEVESDIFFSQQKTTLSSSIESKTGIQLHIADPPLWKIFVQFNSCIMENQVRLLCDFSAIYTMRCQW